MFYQIKIRIIIFIEKNKSLLGIKFVKLSLLNYVTELLLT